VVETQRVSELVGHAADVAAHRRQLDELILDPHLADQAVQIAAGDDGDCRGAAAAALARRRFDVDVDDPTVERVVDVHGGSPDGWPSGTASHRSLPTAASSATTTRDRR
jgi:hypothetical protein